MSSLLGTRTALGKMSPLQKDKVIASLEMRVTALEEIIAQWMEVSKETQFTDEQKSYLNS